MDLRDLWRKYKDWFAVLVFISALTGYTVWYLHLNPQHVPLFLTTTIIALGFVAAMALLPKYRQRLVKAILAHHAKAQKRGGLLYRYGKIFNAVMIAVLLAFCLALYYNPQFFGVEYVPYLVFALFIAFLISAVVFIAGFLRAAGKWGLLLIMILTVIAIFRILIWRYL